MASPDINQQHNSQKKLDIFMAEFMAVEKQLLASDHETALPMRLSAFFDRLLTRIECYHQYSGKQMHGNHHFAWTRILDHAASISPATSH